MYDPDTQGRLMLSFLRERHAPRPQGDPVARPTPWTRRAMFVMGQALVIAGAGLQARGQLSLTRPAAVAASRMETN